MRSHLNEFPRKAEEKEKPPAFKLGVQEHLQGLSFMDVIIAENITQIPKGPLNDPVQIVYIEDDGTQDGGKYWIRICSGCISDIPAALEILRPLEVSQDNTSLSHSICSCCLPKLYPEYVPKDVQISARDRVEDVLS